MLISVRIIQPELHFFFPSIFIDHWYDPSDAKLCRTFQPIRGRPSLTAGPANHTAAADQCTGSDYSHCDWQPDPASDQHPGNHTVTH